MRTAGWDIRLILDSYLLDLNPSLNSDELESETLLGRVQGLLKKNGFKQVGAPLADFSTLAEEKE